MRVFISALVWALVLVVTSSCSRGTYRYELAAESSLKSRLTALVDAFPPPSSWIRVQSGEKVDAIIELTTEPRSPSSSFAGRRYRAAAVALSDTRYSVKKDEAVQLGLVPLEDILPPRRALAVEDTWPGERGYPFDEELFLTIRNTRSTSYSYSPRSAIGAWLVSAAGAAELIWGAPCTLAAAGDFQTAERHGRFLTEDGIDKLLRGGIIDRIRKADIAVVNFEGVASNRGEPNPKKRFHFKMPPHSACALKDAGFDVALLANNHVFDYGDEALFDTLDNFKTARLAVVGAGRNIEEASEPAIFTVPAYGRIRVFGFASFPQESLGFTTDDAAAGPTKPGINADEERTIESIRRAAAEGDTVVVLAHGGAEYVMWTSREIKKRYARFAEAGAALVIGGHPHVLQGIAAEGDSLIAYSLGNFLFTGLEEPEISVPGALVEFLLYKETVRGFRIHPVVVGIEHTSSDPSRAAAERRFSSLCVSSDKESSAPGKR
jgi:poly-gamma-glutamate synthesis protein (capsule biosynthesis protein)